MESVDIKPATQDGKRLQAIFYDKDGKKVKTIAFGAKNGSTYIDHGDKLKRTNYLKRHAKLNEDWNNPMSAGALSKHILWGYDENLDRNIMLFKRRFKFK